MKDWKAVVGTWVHGLAGFSDREIRRGFDAALAGGSSFSPNLPEFIRMIEDSRPRAYHKPWDPNAAIVDKGEGNRLPPPPNNKTPSEHLADMREGL